MITIFYENYIDDIICNVSASYIKGMPFIYDADIFRICNILISEVKNNICYV